MGNFFGTDKKKKINKKDITSQLEATRHSSAKYGINLDPQRSSYGNAFQATNSNISSSTIHYVPSRSSSSYVLSQSSTGHVLSHSSTGHVSSHSSTGHVSSHSSTGHVSSHSSAGHVPSNSSTSLKLLKKNLDPYNHRVPIPSENDVNGYFISRPKRPLPTFQQRDDIHIATNIKVNKFIMKVCPQYNSNRGCDVDMCFRFHVCFYWINGNCIREFCKYDHSFDSSHNVKLCAPFRLRGITDVKLIKCLKHNLFKFKGLLGNGDKFICCQNILKKCKNKQCTFIHAWNSYMWEFEFQNSDKLPFIIGKFLEEKFCQPSRIDYLLIEEGDIPGLRNVRKYLPCRVDFSLMVADTKLNENIKVRRFSTPSDLIVNISTATRWVWYWEENDGTFYPFKHAIVNGFFVIPFSDYLELEFQKKSKLVTCTIGNYVYHIDLFEMIQTNSTTSRRRPIRRIPHLQQSNKRDFREDLNFFTAWKEIPNNNQYSRVEIGCKLPEFDMILFMLRKTLPTLRIKKLERIQNKELWISYQLKKEKMKALLGKSGNFDEQYMFHGTKFSVIEKICSDNFDWRLHGSNVGNVYGKGTYFSNAAKLSDSYAQKDDQGCKCMFVAFVLIGTATLGSRDMQYPPINPETKVPFETTVDNHKNPRIFVKYNMDEYYPAYCVHYWPT